MVGLHNIVGTLVVLAYLVLTVVNVLRARGSDLPWARNLSFAAAGLLLIQYLLGFWLLGDGHRNQAAHYVFALLAIVTVGLEHGYAQTRVTQSARATTALAATAATFILVVIAYSIGQSS
jgi:hypothetical protein